MSDDIVTRLRNTACYDCEMQSEAADEIERLQGLVKHLSSQLRLQIKANDKAWEAYKQVEGGAW